MIVFPSYANGTYENVKLMSLFIVGQSLSTQLV